MFDARPDRRQLLLGGGALALAPVIARARVARAPFDAEAVAALFDRYVREGKLPGAVGSMAAGAGRPVFVARGTIARDSRTAMSPDSLFRIYSMTKPVTGMAAMLLVEDGRLRLDQDIADFIPGFRNPRVLTDPAASLASRPAARPITVRNLMTHTAGLGYSIVTKGPLLAEYLRLGITPGVASRMRLPGFESAPPAPSLKEFADRVATLPLIADPGTRWSYSIGLDVLGRVIEVASGMPFDAFLKRRLFDPLGMRSTFFRVPASELGRMTTNYAALGIAQVPIDRGADTVFADAPAFPFGGAGLVSSPRDYDRFLGMLAGLGNYDGRHVMRRATAKLAMSNLLPPGADTRGTFAAGQGFGAGGRVTIDAADRLGAGIGTFGWGGAAATIAWVDPTRGVRAAGYAQFMPDTAMPFTGDFGRAVYHA